MTFDAWPATDEPFWTAARDGRLTLQRCDACLTLRYFPGPTCPACLEPGGTWVRLSGRGRLYSFTVVHRAPSATFKDECPYIIALIDLVEGPRMMARLTDADPATLQAGTAVALAGVGDSGLGPWPRFRVVGADEEDKHA